MGGRVNGQACAGGERGPHRRERKFLKRQITTPPTQHWYFKTFYIFNQIHSYKFAQKYKISLLLKMHFHVTKDFHSIYRKCFSSVASSP